MSRHTRAGMWLSAAYFALVAFYQPPICFAQLSTTGTISGTVLAPGGAGITPVFQ